MSIILDPTKRAVIIELFCIELKVDNNNFSKIIVLEDNDDIEKWKAKGYEIEEDSVANKQPSPPGDFVELHNQIQEQQKNKNNKIIYKLKFGLTRPTWKEMNVIYAQSMKSVILPDGQTKHEMDIVKFRDSKLKNCIKKWNLKDDNGKDIEISTSVIDSFPPEVAEELLKRFEDLTEPSGTELKKSER